MAPKKTSSIKKHKQSLSKLKESDPEFYKYLETQDKELLQFGEDESDDDEEEDDDDEDDRGDCDDNDESFSEGAESIDEPAAKKAKVSKKKKKAELKDKKKVQDNESDDEAEEFDASDDSEDEGVHKLPQKLEVMSSASESDEDAAKGPKIHVTLSMVKDWTNGLKKHSVPALHNIIQAFKAAVNQASSDKIITCRYKVEDSSVFNAIVRSCIVWLVPCLEKVLDIKKPKDPSKMVLPSSSPKWKKVRHDVKSYLIDLLKLLNDLSQAKLVDSILRHINPMVAYAASFPTVTKSLMKNLINVWSTAEESTRVLAFLSIIRLVKAQQNNLLEPCMKQMYMAYVKNCKFTSPTVLPLINFMQRSLVEIFALDHQMAYQHAFIFIRQLAIHLRNAIMVKKKENCQAVYNWQFVHSLGLWTRLLSILNSSEELEPLIYPLTQTIIGTIKLLPVSRYYPLRFHCIKMLSELSYATNVFIPVLPHILEVFSLTNFDKRHGASSFKPINFDCIIKLSKSQLNERAFKDGTIEQVYGLLVEHFQVHAHSIGFPEFVLPAKVQLKEFTKKCKVANYTKQMKAILEKLEENIQFITNRRKKATIDLKDLRAVSAWEAKIKQEGTPFEKFFKKWKEARIREQRLDIAQKEKISFEDTIPRTQPHVKPENKPSAADRQEFSALFDSDSDASDDETRFMLKSERPEGKKMKKKAVNSEDEYSDLNEEELAMLDKSASEDTEDDDDIEVESDDEDDDDDDDDDGSEEGELDDDDKHRDSEEQEESDDVEDGGDIVEEFRLSDFDDD